jgi:hypothetical protein
MIADDWESPPLGSGVATVAAEIVVTDCVGAVGGGGGEVVGAGPLGDRITMALVGEYGVYHVQPGAWGGGDPGGGGVGPKLCASCTPVFTTSSGLSQISTFWFQAPQKLGLMALFNA